MDVEWEFVIEIDEGNEPVRVEDSGWETLNFALEDDETPGADA